MPRFPRPFAGRKDSAQQPDPVAANNDDLPDFDPPASNLDLAVQMLREAGRIFNALAQENPDLQARMELLAGAYEAVAALTELDPEGEAPAGAETLFKI